MFLNRISIVLGLYLMCSCATKDAAPVARKIEKKLIHQNGTRVDNYYWLNEKTNKLVIDYLNDENKYAEEKLKPVKPLREVLVEELKSRINKDDKSVPLKEGGYFYFNRHTENNEYPTFFRSRNANDKGVVILDGNSLAKGKSYFDLRGMSVEPKNDILAYSVDTNGERKYTLYFKNLKTKTTLKQKIENVTGNFVWAEDGIHLFYTKQNSKTLRSDSVYRYNIKTNKSVRIYFEEDVEYGVFITKTRSKKYLVLTSYAKESREVRIVESSNPLAKFKVFTPRRAGHIYSVAHAGSYFIIKSNKNSPNSKIFRTSDDQHTNEKYWQNYIEHRDNILISSVDVFDKFLVLGIRKDGISEIEIIHKKTKKSYIMNQPEKSHVVYLHENPNYFSKFIRIGYESMTQPSSTVDYDLKTRKKITKKVQKVLGDFKPSNYESKRILASAQDGTLVPISLVYKKGLVRNGENPTLLRAYGSYGHSSEPYFSSARLSLLDRGFVFAVAHIRGGAEMGRHWYTQGKKLNKKNTFTDFIACAEHLIKNDYTSKERIYASGGSAGGLLMGAVINMRPDLFNGVIANVPFVDVLTTMLDESLPLTTAEYEEWGNPNIKKYYDYIESYSPYDNVVAKDYPHLLVSTSLNDSQVSYAEPTKWVAKLRSLKTNEKLLLLKTEMNAGHGGKSGRFQQLEAIARDYAFFIGLEQGML